MILFRKHACCPPLLTLAASLLLAGGLLAASLAAPASGQSLFTDPTAREPGDVLTIVLNEQTAAQRESEYEGSSQASLGGDGSIESPSFSSSFGGDAQISSQSDSRNETVQSELLEGTFTARVTGTDDAGNLVVKGERRLEVNGVTHVMRVTGVVRPLDVRYDNTVPSNQIANADIAYRQLGFQHRIFSTGNLLKAGAAVVLGITAFLGFG